MKWALVGVIVLANACGDLLDTIGMHRHGAVSDFTPAGIARLLHSIFHNLYVLGGISMMALSFFALLSLLSISDVSFAIPATAESYMLEVLLARFVLREEVHWQRWLGATLVTAGVALLALP